MGENKRFTVQIDAEAVTALTEHARFLARVSEKAAKRLVREFYEKASSLESLAERNPFVAETVIAGEGYRKLLFEKRYLLIYIVEGDTVYVDDVVDCRKEYSWLL